MGNHSSTNTYNSSGSNASWRSAAPVSLIDEVKLIHRTLSEEDKKLFKFASDAIEKEKEKLGNTEILILFRDRGALMVRSEGEKGAVLKRVLVGFNEKKEPEWRLSVDEYAFENFHELSDVIPKAVPI